MRDLILEKIKELLKTETSPKIKIRTLGETNLKIDEGILINISDPLFKKIMLMRMEK